VLASGDIKFFRLSGLVCNTFYLENLLKFVVVRLPSESMGVLSKLGYMPFKGLTASSFGLYSSSEKADTGARGVIFVA